MINISVLTEELSLDSLKFVLSISTDGVVVRYIIISPDSVIHPKRKYQINLKKQIFGNNLYRDKNIFKNFILDILNLLRIKKVIIFIIAKVLGLIKGFKIVSFKKGWPNEIKTCLKHVCVIHSFEGIIAEPVINLFQKGIINIHPAIIPKYRGLDAGLWALYEGGELGVSAYLVDNGIDTGSIIKTYSYQRDAVKSVENYLTSLKKLKIDSYVDAIKSFATGKLENSNPKITRNQNRGIMPEETLLYFSFNTSF